jgi:hypothetical protein
MLDLPETSEFCGYGLLLRVLERMKGMGPMEQMLMRSNTGCVLYIAFTGCVLYISFTDYSL